MEKPWEFPWEFPWLENMTWKHDFSECSPQMGPGTLDTLINRAGLWMGFSVNPLISVG
jgi:hypothetical protein